MDRLKAEKVGLTPTDVFNTLQVYLGSQYVNDFNFLGRTYQVIAQADGPFRRDQSDLMGLKTRNTAGGMVPIGTVAPLRDQTIPYRVPRYNLYPAAEVQGVAAPGVATGEALKRMEQLAGQVLPQGIGYDGRRSPSSRSRKARRPYRCSAPRPCSSSWCSRPITRVCARRWQWC